jgi:hypothetical protein
MACSACAKRRRKIKAWLKNLGKKKDGTEQK